MHWLLRWLREGDEAVASLPPHTLRLLLAEARHWGMGELAERCSALLGAPGATDEGAAAPPNPNLALTVTVTVTVTVTLTLTLTLTLPLTL